MSAATTLEDIAKAKVLDRGDHAELVEHIKSLYAPEGDTCKRLVHTEGDFFAYDEATGTWSAEGVEASIARHIKKLAGTMVCKGKNPFPLCIDSHDVTGVLTMLAREVAHKEFFVGESGVSCRNGYLTMVDGKATLTDKSENNRARGYVAVDYDENATSPELDKLLDDTFRDDTDKKDKINLLAEFAGGALFGKSAKHQRCLILVGEGANGKSSVLEVISSVFPKHDVVSSSPTKWGERFRIASLVGARLNVVTELPNGLLESDIFKAIVTGDPVEAERKGKDQFVFSPRAGHIFGANALPGTRDQSYGFWRRFLAIPFNRNYELDGAEKGIAKRIAAENAGAILAWLVKGAERLEANDEYTLPVSHKQSMAEWRLASDSVASFVEAVKAGGVHVVLQKKVTVVGTNGASSYNKYQPEDVYVFAGQKYEAKSMYDVYTQWAKDNGLKPVSLMVFSQRAQKLGMSKKKNEKGMTFYELPG